MRIIVFSAISTFALVTFSSAASAQTAKIPLIGYLSGSVPETNQHVLKSFRLGLAKLGFVDGKNAKVIFGWARRDRSKLQSMASDLVSQGVDVIVATGGTPAIRAAIKATSTIPIVFGTGANPLRIGVIKNLGRPSGNVTGVSFHSYALTPKIFQYLRSILPGSRRIAFMHDLRMPDAEDTKRRIEVIAKTEVVALESFPVKSRADIISALRIVERGKFDALLTGSSPLINNSRRSVIKSADQARIPVFANTRDYAKSGALFGYGASREEMFFNLGRYAGRILRGARTANLPVLMPNHFQMTINLRVSKALGISIPASLFALADEIID